MLRILRYGLLLVNLIFSQVSGYSNAIDNLKTKDDLKEFLDANIGKTGIFFLRQCASIPQTEKIPIYGSEPDTIEVEDPETGKWSKRVMPPRRYDALNCEPNTQEYPENYSYDSIINMVMKNSLYFHKVDIDRNGLTDLIVDASIVLIVMDMDIKYEGHMFSLNRQDSYSFKNIIPLSDSAVALLLKHKTCANNINSEVIDTIVYKFRGFVKYNANFKPLSITKIEYSYHHSSDVFCLDGYTFLQINKDGKCFLQYIRGIGYAAVNYSATFDNTKLRDLWNLISYVDIKSKKDSYRCPGTADDSYGNTFVIYFEDGSLKRIDTWDYCPITELSYLSKNISDISTKLKWHRYDNPLNFKHLGSTPRFSQNYLSDCDCKRQ